MTVYVVVQQRENGESCILAVFREYQDAHDLVETWHRHEDPWGGDRSVYIETKELK